MWHQVNKLESGCWPCGSGDLMVYFEDPFSGSVEAWLWVWASRACGGGLRSGVPSPELSWDLGHSPALGVLILQVCDRPRGPAGLYSLEGME